MLEHLRVEELGVAGLDERRAMGRGGLGRWEGIREIIYVPGFSEQSPVEVLDAAGDGDFTPFGFFQECAYDDELM